MGTDRWPVDFRYISSRLVLQIVQQDAATRSRWKLSAISIPWLSIGFRKDRIDRHNESILVREATAAVRDNTSTTIAQSWGTFIRTELDLTMGLVPVLMGWTGTRQVDIAAMKAEVNDSEAGRVLVALFGSASNYRGRTPTSDGMAEIPSDVDGLYGILERTREPNDPEIHYDYLDRDIGHTPNSRVDTAITLLDGRFKGFREGRFDLLMQTFCTVEDADPYDLVILGAPVWVATPEPKPMRNPKDRFS
jgi:hypothetical protein